MAVFYYCHSLQKVCLYHALAPEYIVQGYYFIPLFWWVIVGMGVV